MKVLTAIFDCIILLIAMVTVLLTSILLYPLTIFSKTAYDIVKYRNPEIADYLLKVLQERIEDVS